MKITYIHQYFSNLEMPGSTRSFELGRRLVKQGHKVNMIATYRKDDVAHTDWFVTDEAGIDVHWLPLPYSNALSFKERIKAFFRFAYKAAVRAAEIDSDVIYASSTPLTIALPGVYAAWKQKAPMVFEVRDLWPDVPIAVGVLPNRFFQFLARRLERFAYNRSAHIVALSPTMKEEIIKKGYSPDMISMIPNASDISSFPDENRYQQDFNKKYPELKNRPFVLYAGALGFVNNVEYMVDIAVAARSICPELAFVVFGEGREREHIYHKASASGVLNKSFFLFNRLPKKEIPLVFSSCSVSTSFVIDVQAMWANSANKFFDTLAAAKPIAINHRGWQADLIEEYNCGLVLPPSNPTQAAHLLCDYVADSEQLSTAGVNARRLAVEKFDRDTLAYQLEKILQKVASRE